MADTIFALSSGPMPAAIAVMRVSGPKALETIGILTGRAIPPRRATLAALRFGDELLDRAIVLRFDGPDTATGEDLAEFHLHGSRAVVAAVSRALGAVPGVREAEAGEFTRRAFANGRLDLAEAEGLADLLAAETDAQRRAALLLAGGALSRKVAQWHDQLAALAAAVEAQLDFADEGDVAAGLPASWGAAHGALAGEMAAWLARPAAERLRDGVRVVIAGPPNSGKSTLLNALAGREAAIVSAIAGTTRDLIEVPLVIDGIPLVLVDSAGLRPAGDDIEAIGIERARSAIAAGDLVLWLGAPEERPEHRQTVLVHAKSDLGSPTTQHDVSISAATGHGMAELARTIVARAKERLPREGETPLNSRHRAALAIALQHIDAAAQHEDMLLAAEEMRQAERALGAITGRSGVEHMLDALFGRFCIGK